MARLAREGSRRIEIRNLAVELTTRGFGSAAGLRQKDFLGEARRLSDWVRDHIRYVGDIEDVETIADPVSILRIGAGDCDDKATLLAALLLSIGHTPRFVALAQQPGQFNHVWVQDLVDGRWIDLETTEPLPFGKSVPTHDAAGLIAEGI